MRPEPALAAARYRLGLGSLGARAVTLETGMPKRQRVKRALLRSCRRFCCLRTKLMSVVERRFFPAVIREQASSGPADEADTH